MERVICVKRKHKERLAVQTQLRDGEQHPFSLLRGGGLPGGDFRVLRQVKEAVPIVDGAVGKLVRLMGGFSVQCRDPEGQRALECFLRSMPCGRGQRGVEAFLSAYTDMLLTYGCAVGEMIVSRGRLVGVCWGDVTKIQVEAGDSLMETVILGPDAYGAMRPLPYQNLLLFTTLNPEPGHPYGVSLLRGMPFFADILMKIYQTIGVNWERAGNLRYSVVYKPGNEPMDTMMAESRSQEMAQQWAKAMEDGKNGRVRDFVAVGDVEIKIIGADGPILDSQVPVRQILEQIVAKTGLPPFLLGLSWSSTERMSAQQVDMLTSELQAFRRCVTPVLERICGMFLRLEGYGGAVEILWDDISLQDITEEAKAEYYRAQAESIRNSIQEA